MPNGVKSNEWRRIWVWETYKIEIKKWGPNNSDTLQNWFPQQIRFLLFNLQKFQDSEKFLNDSCIIDWNLMNDEEFGFRKLLKLENRRADQMIQTFSKIGSPQKLGPASLIWRNLKTLRELLLNHTKCIES